MSRRTVALVLAIVLAGLATVALLSWAKGLEDRAFEGAETVEILKAKDLIPAGTSGDDAISQGLVERTTIVKKIRPEGAIASLEEIRGKVAAVDIVKDEAIVGARFVLPGEQAGRLPVPQNRVGVAAEVDIPPGVAGFIKPGDRVSIIASIQVEIVGGPLDGEEDTLTQHILQNVQVLAVGQRTVANQIQQSNQNQEQQQQQQQASNRVMLTLALTPSQAERLVHAIQTGEIYFTLLPKGARAVDTAGRNASNIFPD